MTWMREAGMTVSIDASGAVVGRLDGTAKAAKTLLIGSHLDTLHDASRFDGPLGIVLPIEVLVELRRLGKRLPFAIEIVAYGNDAGRRFPAAHCGNASVSQALVDDAVLDAVDGDGIKLRDALAVFGCDDTALAGTARQPKDILGYIEMQVDQSATLEMERVPIGIVTSIQGVSRFHVQVGGKSGTARARQSALPRDALVASAEMILAIERIAKASPALTATVGQMRVRPEVANTMPLSVSLTIDIRSAVDRTRRRGALDIDRELRLIARRRQIGITVAEVLSQQAVACDPRFIAKFNTAADKLGHTTMGLPSALPHGGLPIAGHYPVGLLLVRGRDGGGNPAGEVVSAEDIEIAARHLMQALDAMAPNGRNLT